MPLSRAILHPKPVSFLYRKVLKSIPKTMSLNRGLNVRKTKGCERLYVDVCRTLLSEVLYDLDMTEKDIQGAVRRLFRKNSNVTDPRVLDRLLYDGETHLAETVEMWKQKTHLARLLSEN